MQHLPVLGVGRPAHTLQPDLGCARVAADGEEDCVELVHELGAVIILGGRIELESEIDVRVMSLDQTQSQSQPFLLHSKSMLPLHCVYAKLDKFAPIDNITNLTWRR